MRSSKRAPLYIVVAIATAVSIWGIGCRVGDQAPVAPSASSESPKFIAPGAIQIGSRATTDFGDAVATSARTADGVSTTLRDGPGGTVLATLVWSYSAATFTWNVTGVGSQSEATGGVHVSLKGSNAAVYYIYKAVQTGVALGKAEAEGRVFDNPGCDWFPDFLETECILDCCETHDQCYAQNNCTWKSWIPFVGSSACKACNRAVVLCIAGCVVDAVIDIIVPR
jgi:hypothetical protein